MELDPRRDEIVVSVPRCEFARIATPHSQRAVPGEFVFDAIMSMYGLDLLLAGYGAVMREALAR